MALTCLALLPVLLLGELAERVPLGLLMSHSACSFTAAAAAEAGNEDK